MKEDIVSIVSLPEWQTLRASFVGTWKHTPVSNVQKLRKFLKGEDKPRRYRIVHNYLTGSAFRIGIIQHPEIDKLLAEVRKVRNKTK